MIKIFEEYTENFGKKMKSLDKIKELSVTIARLYQMIFNDLDYEISEPSGEHYFINFHDQHADSIFKCELSLSESMVKRNNFSVNIKLDWYMFVSESNKNRCKSFYKFLRPIVSPGGFHSVDIKDIDLLISQLNIDDYRLSTDVDKYNL